MILKQVIAPFFNPQMGVTKLKKYHPPLNYIKAMLRLWSELGNYPFICSMKQGLNAEEKQFSNMYRNVLKNDKYYT